MLCPPNAKFSNFCINQTLLGIIIITNLHKLIKNNLKDKSASTTVKIYAFNHGNSLTLA